MTGQSEARSYARERAGSFGRKVRQLRRAEAWTLDGLAQRLEAGGFSMTLTTLSKLEAGRRPTSIEELYGLAVVFGCSPAELLPDGGSYDDTARRLHEELQRSAQGEELKAARAQAAELAKRIAELEALQKGK